ncbi:MAG: hypothetical protein KAI79_07405 [Bacteroidales bacterium]|nr:hypothetical protein [Bacteroidales bacterium]
MLYKAKLILTKKIIGIAILAISVLIFGCDNNTKTNTKTKSTSNKINVAVFKGDGVSPTCVIETFEALKIDSGISPQIITAAEITAGKLNDFEVIIFPGGSGSKELNNLGQIAATKVLDFVKAGNAAVGICAGGYLFSTTKDYPSLRLVSATEWDREHYDKGRALIEFELSTAGLEIFPELKNRKSFLQYYDGPVLMASDSGKSGVQKYIEHAKYVSDITVHPNYPSGITPGKSFILGEDYGNGRAMVIAGHPESTPGMRWMVPRMARWAANKELISYNSKWIKPELNNSEIFFKKELVKQEKEYFWQLSSNIVENKLIAMQKLYEMRSRPAVRWNLGMLRDNNAQVRTLAAHLLQETEYTAAIPDLQIAFNIETDTTARSSIKKAIYFLSKF